MNFLFNAERTKSSQSTLRHSKIAGQFTKIIAPIATFKWMGRLVGGLTFVTTLRTLRDLSALCDKKNETHTVTELSQLKTKNLFTNNFR